MSSSASLSLFRGEGPLLETALGRSIFGRGGGKLEGSGGAGVLPSLLGLDSTGEVVLVLTGNAGGVFFSCRFVVVILSSELSLDFGVDVQSDSPKPSTFSKVPIPESGLSF